MHSNIKKPELGSPAMTVHAAPQQEKMCDKCNGTGQVDGEKCPTCDGTGKYAK